MPTSMKNSFLEQFQRNFDNLWPRYETSGWKSSHFLAFRRKPAARILLNNASNFWSICVKLSPPMQISSRV
ncbi:Exoribonuclease 2 [Frankliniella fusca]|uniref:Exoribonuclease 2 n=1 Tax=Frankliniella fusca TaxID=407009 RepID=A0AAE1LIS9_9NEOP|nr:Exoribonuclease 2 [Frankliniella fusca]